MFNDGTGFKKSVCGNLICGSAQCIFHLINPESRDTEDGIFSKGNIGKKFVLSKGGNGFVYRCDYSISA